MEGIEYYIDDMITLPGFVNRHLALMRELDQRAYEALMKADDLEQEYFKLKAKNETNNDLGDNVKNSSDANSNFTSQSGDLLNDKITFSQAKHKIDNSRKRRISKDTSISSTHKDDCPHVDSDSRSSSCSPRSIAPTSDDKEPIVDLVVNIQKYRQESVLALKEKINVNEQLVCMLKHENERMKQQFDIMYRRMEKNGQLPPELKFKVENGIDMKDEYERQSTSGFSSDSESLKNTKSYTNRISPRSSSSEYKSSKYSVYGNLESYDRYNVNGGSNKSCNDNYEDVWDGICPICNKGEDAQDEFGMVGCDACNNWFHFHCVNYSNTCRDEPWFCPKCESHR